MIVFVGIAVILAVTVLGLAADHYGHKRTQTARDQLAAGQTMTVDQALAEMTWEWGR